MQILADHRRLALESETKEAARRLAEQTDENNLAWLQARQRSVEGGENGPVAVESLGAGDATES